MGGKMDRDPLGLNDEQLYHEPILKWLQERQIHLLIEDHPEGVFFLDPSGDDVTDDFMLHFEQEFDYLKIEERHDDLEDGRRSGKISLYTNDHNCYVGGPVVHWDGQMWSIQHRD
jgi:hypothetical protein